jgi:hypothetical protein
MIKCTCCGSTEQIQKHHTSYNPPIIIPLCRKCHQKQHKGHGVGVSSLQIKIIPADYPDSWRTMSYKQLTKKYGISTATVNNWAKKMELSNKKKVFNYDLLDKPQVKNLHLSKGSKLFVMPKKWLDRFGDVESVLVCESECHLTITPITVTHKETVKA